MPTPAYHTTLAELGRDYRTLVEERAALDRRITQVHAAIATLTALTHEPAPFAGSLADACRTVLQRTSTRSLTPQEVREELRQLGYALDRHANPMAAIHGVLKRLVEAGDASRVAYASGTVYWWGSGPPPPPGSVKVLVGNLQQTLQAAGTVDPALVALVARVARQVRHVASQLDPRVLENLQDVAVRVQDAVEVTPELEEQVLATATKVREIVARLSLGGL